MLEIKSCRLIGCIGAVSAGRYDGARLRAHCRNLTVLVRILRRQSSSEEDRHHIQTLFGTTLVTGKLQLRYVY